MSMFSCLGIRNLKLTLTACAEKQTKPSEQNRGVAIKRHSERIENEILMYFRNQKKTAQDVSMNEPIDTDSEGNPLTLSDIIYTEDTIADDLDTKIKIERLRRYIQEMPATREKEIIVRRYGLDGNFPETQREIAERLHISRSYVSRIEKRVLQELRKKFAE